MFEGWTQVLTREKIFESGEQLLKNATKMKVAEAIFKRGEMTRSGKNFGPEEFMCKILWYEHGSLQIPNISSLLVNVIK